MEYQITLMIVGCILVFVIIFIIIMMQRKKSYSTTTTYPTYSTTTTTTYPVVTKKNYIMSPFETYLILNDASTVSKTVNYKEATPVSLTKIAYKNKDFFAMQTETGKYICSNGSVIKYSDNYEGCLVLNSISPGYQPIYILGSDPTLTLQISLRFDTTIASNWGVVSK